MVPAIQSKDLKLMQQQYALLDVVSLLSRGNELCQVLKILFMSDEVRFMSVEDRKRLGRIPGENAAS